MELKKHLMTSSLLLATLLLTGCSFLSKPEEVVVVRTVVEKPQIPLQPKARPVELNDVKFYVVTRDNLEEFLQEFDEVNGDTVFVAMSVPHYESLSLNLAEIRRYLKQQDSIVVYYETQITEKLSDINKETKENTPEESQQ
jgi:hypothetical protein